jgi:hypothetical protein
MSPVGLPRSYTLRSWLPQWGYDDADGDGIACGNDACTPSHTRRLFAAIGDPDQEMHEISSATNYCAGLDRCDALPRAVRIGAEVHHHLASIEAPA